MSTYYYYEQNSVTNLVLLLHIRLHAISMSCDEHQIRYEFFNQISNSKKMYVQREEKVYTFMASKISYLHHLNNNVMGFSFLRSICCSILHYQERFTT